MALVEIDNLHAGYTDRTVLRNVGMRVESGERWAIIGRNGTGKSTLIRTIAALLTPTTGEVRVNNRDVFALSARERARHIAYMPQKPEAPIPYTVSDFVMLGRYAEMGLFGLPGTQDRRAVTQALSSCDIRGLAQRMMTTLSGGELQRVLLAGALVQEAPLLLLDEPTTFLDPAHERLFFEALSAAHQSRDLTVLMVTHDINTALTACTHILALREGECHFAGTVDDFRAQCPALLTDIYGIGFTSYVGHSTTDAVYGTWESAV